MKPDSWVVKPDAAPPPSAGSSVIWDGDLNTSVRLVARQSSAWLSSFVRRPQQGNKSCCNTHQGPGTAGCTLRRSVQWCAVSVCLVPAGVTCRPLRPLRPRVWQHTEHWMTAAAAVGPGTCAQRDFAPSCVIPALCGSTGCVAFFKPSIRLLTAQIRDPLRWTAMTPLQGLLPARGAPGQRLLLPLPHAARRQRGRRQPLAGAPRHRRGPGAPLYQPRLGACHPQVFETHACLTGACSTSARLRGRNNAAITL